MQPIDPAELSAFLDGELPAERAQEVRDALASDPSLRQAYEKLAALDTTWKSQAETVMFQPRVHFAKRSSFDWYTKATVVVVALLLLRLAIKTFPPLYAVGFEAILLTVVLGWGLQRIMQTTDADYGHYFAPQAS